ncbi:hypothetical protein GVAV_001723 [Gurleya vavrai]
MKLLLLIRYIALFKNHQNIKICGLNSLMESNNKEQICDILFTLYFAKNLRRKFKELKILVKDIKNESNWVEFDKFINRQFEIFKTLNIEHYCNIIDNKKFFFNFFGERFDENNRNKSMFTDLKNIFIKFVSLKINKNDLYKIFKIMCIEKIQIYKFLQTDIETQTIIFFIADYEIQNNLNTFKTFEFKYYEEFFLILNNEKNSLTQIIQVHDLLGTFYMNNNALNSNPKIHMDNYIKKQEKIIELFFQLKDLESLLEKYNVTKNIYRLRYLTTNDAFDQYYFNKITEKEFFIQTNEYIHMQKKNNIIFLSNHSNDSFSEFLEEIHHTYLSEYIFFSIYLETINLKIEYQKVKEFYYQEDLIQEKNLDFGRIIYFLIYLGIKEYFDKFFDIEIETNSIHPLFEIGFIKYEQFIISVEKNTIKKVYDVLITKKELKMKIHSFYNVKNEKIYSLESTFFDKKNLKSTLSDREVFDINNILYFAVKYSFYSIINSSHNENMLKFQIYIQIELFFIFNYIHIIKSNFKIMKKQMFTNKHLSLQDHISEIFDNIQSFCLVDMPICYTIFLNEKSNLTLPQKQIIISRKIFELIFLDEITRLKIINFLNIESNSKRFTIYIHLVIINSLEPKKINEDGFYDKEFNYYHYFSEHVISNADFIRNHFYPYQNFLKTLQIDLFII